MYINMSRLVYSLGIVSLILLLGACGVTEYDNVEFDKSDLELALPLINTEVSIARVADRVEGNTAIVVDSEGRPTIKYRGDILAQRAEDIFPAFPGFIDIIIPSPNSSWNLDEISAFTSAFENNIIRKAYFLNNNVTFRVQHNEPKPITFDIRVPTITNNGEAFHMQYTIPPKTNDADIHRTESVSIDGWLFLPIGNNIEFEYTATDENGNVVNLNYAAMNFDFFNFSYIEGYFDERIYDIQGDVINVGLFNNWVSGGIEIENPQLSIGVENSFGFPVKTEFNQLEVSTVTGNVHNITSTLIDEGVIFDYPSLDEVGEVKYTEIVFDRDNSNIGQIFLDKVSKVRYDIDARTNPDGSQDDNGFMNRDSYFKIVASVDLPLKGLITDLIITDTVDVDLGSYDEIESGELKFVMYNDYPTQVSIDMYSLDSNGQVLDQLFDQEPLLIDAADVNEQGKTIAAKQTVRYLPVDNEKYQKFFRADRIVILAKIDSQVASNEYLWLYDDYKIDFKVGAKIKLK